MSASAASGIVARYRERLHAHTKAPPEDSIAIRAVVGAIVIVSVLAVLAQGVVDPLTGIAAVVLPPIGFWFSYVQRNRANRGTKVVLAVGLLAAFAAFLQNVRYAQNVDEARTSLASLFLWVQVLHTFDVPRRRDLGFSVAASVILMAEAGSLSLDASFAFFLVPWSVLMAAWLVLTAPPRPGTLAPVVRRSRGPGAAPSGPRRWGRTVAGGTAVLVGTSALVFLLTPRLPGAVVVTPPFRLGGVAAGVPAFDGQAVNPGASGSNPDAAPDFSGSAYPGFGERVDLRSRGRLSDEVVLKVRSPRAALWRGEAFDVFDGTAWSIGDRETITAVSREGGAQDVPWLEEPTVPTERVVQTFYVQARQPNVVFGAWRPSEIYFPAAGLRVDAFGSVRSPIFLDEGMVYSVVSQVPQASPALLRSIPGAWSRETLELYTQLPAGFSPRVRDLAERITAGAASPYDAVIAVQGWLRAHTRYNLDVGPEPEGADVIERFLFDTREGYCEHIASSMALLLRAAGIPTRLATGFGPGERNPFTGYFEVKASDAHAWVEVLYPGVGWVPYDPTFGVPPAQTSLGDRILLPRVLGAVARFVSSIVPDPLEDALRTAGRAALRAWPAVLLAAVAIVWLILRRRRGSSRSADGPPQRPAARAFVELSGAFGERGRRPAETPEEFLRRLRSGPLADADRSDAALVVQVFEHDRFARSDPDGEEIAAALAAAARVRERAAARDG